MSHPDRAAPTPTSRRGLLGPLAVLTAAAVIGSAARAQNYPSRQVTVIFPTGPGSPSDLIGRYLNESFAAQTRVPFVAENRAGANGILGMQAARNAQADGQTLVFTTISTISLNKFLIRDLPYDPQTDFSPVGIMARSNMVLSVGARSPFRNAMELIDYAKRNPGKLNFGYGTAMPQMSGKLLEQLSGTEFTFVPYRTGTAMILAITTGEVDVSINDGGSISEFIRNGQVRALATSGEARMTSLPDVPTFVEAGIAGYEVSTWNGLFARSGTPGPIMSRLGDMMRVALQSPALQGYLARNALDTFLATGAVAADYVSRDIQRWGEVVRRAGIVPS